MTKKSGARAVSHHSLAGSANLKRRRLVQAAGTVLAAAALPATLARAVISVADTWPTSKRSRPSATLISSPG